MPEKRGDYFSFETYKEGEDVVLRVNAEDCPFFPSIEDNAICMSSVIDQLIENPGVTRVVLSQKRDYEYDYDQVNLLAEIGKLRNHIVKQQILFSLSSLGGVFRGSAGERRSYEIRDILYNKLRNDPILAYVELRRMYRKEKVELERRGPDPAVEKYLTLIDSLLNALEKTKLIALAKPHLPEYKDGNREIYHFVFAPVAKPDFMFTRLMAAFPLDGEEIDSYRVQGSDVTIFRLPSTVHNLYHIVPPEFKLTEDKYELLDAARRIISEHKPSRSEFIDPERVRQVFFNVGSDLLEELSEQRDIKLRAKETEELAEILVRYTIGFGLIEVLLKDEKIQDITVNSPMGRHPVFIVHQDYDDCMTNIIPTINDADSWATKLRLMSGRPLDEANPILDTELLVPGARARVAVVGEPLNPKGTAYAFRRHRDKPWTFPLMIKNRMMNPLSAGLLSFLIDGSRTMLVAGTRSAGKTSVLGAMMVEIMRKYRMITVEDTLELPVAALKQLEYNIQPMKVASVFTKGSTEVSADEGIRATLRMGDSCLIVGEVRSSLKGDQEVTVIYKGLTKHIPIKDVEELDPEYCLVPTLGFDLKTRLSPLTAFIKHPPRSRLLEIKTRTGRKVVVTPDHSLFTATPDFKIAPVECQNLKLGSQIVIPTKIPIGYNDVECINLTQVLSHLRLKGFETQLKQAISVVGYQRATALCEIKSNDVYKYLRNGVHQKVNIPITSLSQVMAAAELPLDLDNLSVTKGTGNGIPAVIPFNEDFCSFLGYYISEGYYSQEEGEGGTVVLTNSNRKVLEDMKGIIQRLFKITPSERQVHGAGISYQLKVCSVALAELLKWLGCGRVCTEKRVPPILFGLPKMKIAAFLQTLYEGDGCMTVSESSGNCIRYNTTSMKLAEDVAYLLLSFGIVARIYKRPAKTNPVWIVEFKSREMVESFTSNIGFKFKGKAILKRKWAHSKSDIVHFDKSALRIHLKTYPRKYRHLFRYGKCTKSYLKQVVNDSSCEASEQLKSFANGNFYLDEVTGVNEILLNDSEPVYDLSVAPSQNFVGGFGGLLLHNTEALALYEAMRIGALANVVAGTIHGDSPYGVFDRVVNDLKVPRTSFKATDIVIVANPIKSPDGLHRWRRMTQITEVGKYWENDPLLEKGFKDLMKYDSKTDQLEPTLDLLNGESDILKSIASNVKEWAGSWDAVWDNVMLRTQVKEAIVDAAKKSGQDELLEAAFVVHANDEFHKIAERVKDDMGAYDNKKIFFDWNEWLKKSVKRKQNDSSQ